MAIKGGKRGKSRKRQKKAEKGGKRWKKPCRKRTQNELHIFLMSKQKSAIPQTEE